MGSSRCCSTSAIHVIMLFLDCQRAGVEKVKSLEMGGWYCMVRRVLGVLFRSRTAASSNDDICELAMVYKRWLCSKEGCEAAGPRQAMRAKKCEASNP